MINTTLDFDNVIPLEFDGVDHSDYPDYCDAYIIRAKIKCSDNTLREATEDEIEEINENFYFVYEKLMDHLY